MATSRPLPGSMQMISKDGQFSYSETQGFLEELRQYSNASSQCAVISIMGPQYSGRSYLVNSLFGTNFDVGPNKKPRTQTTEGIWIARYINPRMIIMDTEGIRKDGALIDQRRIARFVLTVSDVLLLNMWFSEISRKKGLSIEVLRLIFEESIKIDAPQRRTKIIVCLRDFPSTAGNIRSEPKYSSKTYSKKFFEKLWNECMCIDPEATNKNMSDYIEVINIQCFPSKERQEYNQKTKVLAEFVCSLAESGSLKQNHDPYCFAIYSRWAWALNCGYESPKIELAVSTYDCSEIVNGILNSLDAVEGYGSLMSGTSDLVDFDAELLLFLSRVQSRYEKETQTFDKKIRDEKKGELVTRIVERFKPAFGDKSASLAEAMCSRALSNLPDQLGELGELEESAIIEVLRDNYIKQFDEISLTDLHPYYGEMLNSHRDKLQMRLAKIAEEEKHKIQLKQMQDALDKKDDENKVLKRKVKEYEKFRTWIEDQASNSYGMVKYTEFTPLEIKTALDDSRTVFLGEGGYGRVDKALIDGKTVAIKSPKSVSDGKAFEQEVGILKRILHPNLVTLIGACPRQYTLVYEFLPNGSLEDRLFPTTGKEALSWEERIKIASSICAALIFLHNTKPNPIAHGDLKPDNILFDSNNVCKLSDFGISRILNYTNDTKTPGHVTQEPKGTSYYMDPEFSSTRKLTPQSDVFAFGIILLQLVTGERAIKLRDFVVNVLENRKLEILQPSLQKRILQRLLDTKLTDPPINEVVKMISMGLWCSDDARKNRPDLESQVLSVIESVSGFAS